MRAIYFQILKFSPAPMADVFAGSEVSYQPGVFPGSERPEGPDPREAFRNFIHAFQVGYEYVYRQQLLANYRQERYILLIATEDIQSFDPSLMNALALDPDRCSVKFEQAALEVLAFLLSERGRPADEVIAQLRPVQVVLMSRDPSTLTPLRMLLSDQMNRLVTVRGIVTAVGRNQPKATLVKCVCRGCGHIHEMHVRQGFAGIRLPRRCLRIRDAEIGASDCPLDPYRVRPDLSTFVDHRTIKIQEPPEEVPTGEMPRVLLVAADRALVDVMTPGQRVVVCGVFSAFNAANRRRSGERNDSIRQSYIRALGIATESAPEGAGEGGFGGLLSHSIAPQMSFTPDEEEAFKKLARSPNFRRDLMDSVCPALFGFEDEKAAIAALLFGGTTKRTEDGIRLRGDINVLLLGDPGAGKSQALKWVEQAAPIGVYTSGKGSSAAGLTAAVTRDAASGEFALEGGAMVLADKGVVCIDEFDKMRDQDRVAIHEAMEQQTISVAKAGITTVLNSRASVLAAANPVFGRYDDLRSAAEQIEFQATILSRFDLIFIVRDRPDAEHDRHVSSHVLALQFAAKRAAAGGQQQSETEPPIPLATLRRYVQYARSTCHPRLTREAAEVLTASYVEMRAELASLSAEGTPTIPVTVRQLEALVRVSEANARMCLREEVMPTDVEEALRLFRRSTLAAARSGFLGSDNPTDRRALREIATAEREIRGRMPIGSSLTVAAIQRDLQGQGLSGSAVSRALVSMEARGELEARRKGRVVFRRR